MAVKDSNALLVDNDDRSLGVVEDRFRSFSELI